MKTAVKNLLIALAIGLSSIASAQVVYDTLTPLTGLKYPPPPPPPGSPAAANYTQRYDTAVLERDGVYRIVEQMPQYPGGEKAMMRFIQERINYPDYERENDIQGRVVLSFIVNEDGGISDVRIRKSVSKGIDAEAARVIGLFPKFIPGMQQGKAVKVSYIMPIMFKLAGGDDAPPVVTRPYPMPPVPGTDTSTYTPPSFPGGDDALMSYIARENKRHNKGKDSVTCVVIAILDAKGNVIGAHSMYIQEDKYMREAISIVHKLPEFIPASQKGSPVSSFYVIPVVFRR